MVVTPETHAVMLLSAARTLEQTSELTGLPLEEVRRIARTPVPCAGCGRPRTAPFTEPECGRCRRLRRRLQRKRVWRLRYLGWSVEQIAATEEITVEQVREYLAPAK